MAKLHPQYRRLSVLLAVGMAAILAALGYRHFWFPSMGSGPAGPFVAGEPFAPGHKDWSDRKVLLLGVGDSVTTGYGAPAGKGYFARLFANPPDEFPDMQGKSLSSVLPRLARLNVAIEGTTSHECISVELPNVPAQDAATFGIVVITTGGNDIIHNYGRTPPREYAMYGATLEQARPWIENYRSELTAILDQISAKFPGGCEFYVANIYDPTDGLGDAKDVGLPDWPNGLKIIAAYNAVIADVVAARKNAVLVNMHDLFFGHGIHSAQFWLPAYVAGDPHYWYWVNLEDPNERGYDALRRLFLNAMVRTLPPLLQSGPS
jgi:lysophospholipase L1-like esterase